MATLDDVFASSMRKPRKLLDLSKTKIFSDEDYLKYSDRVPEMKITPETIFDDGLIPLTDFTFNLSNQEKVESGLPTYLTNFPFTEPIPESMRAVRLEDLSLVDIHWKMLTDLRPLDRKEEDYFNRLVDLGKFRRNTRLEEAKELALAVSRGKGSSSGQGKAMSLGFVVYKSKKGTTETKIKSCKECGVELCSGKFCKLQHYDLYKRVLLDDDELEAEEKGFSLRAVIDQANATNSRPAPPIKKRASISQKNKSLKTMISKAKKGSKKRKM